MFTVVVLYGIVLFLSISIALLTAWAFQKCSRPQLLTLCRSLRAEALQATASEGLAQGPFVVAGAEFEPAVERHRLYQCATTPHKSDLIKIINNDEVKLLSQLHDSFVKSIEYVFLVCVLHTMGMSWTSCPYEALLYLFSISWIRRVHSDSFTQSFLPFWGRERS